MIGPFRGKYFFLSNFYPVIIEYEGINYPTSEHAFQAAKTTVIFHRKSIADISSTSSAKRYGRGLILRPNWDNIRIAIMTDIMRIKFVIPELRNKLLDTGNEEIVEINTWGDNFWGVSGKLEDGQNNLGKILMQVRQEINAMV